MTRFRRSWEKLVRAETPNPAELGAAERELASCDDTPLPAPVVERLTRDVVGSMRFPRSPRRSPFRSLLLLATLLASLTGTAAIGTRLIWPQGPARLATAPLDEAFAHLAARDASKEHLQLAMGVLDRHVFQALTTLKNLAGAADEVGAAARELLQQLHAARAPMARPASSDVPAFVATANDANAPLADRLAAVHALGDCIAAGMTALQDVELQEEDLRIARSVYVRRLLRDLEKAAAAATPATTPAASEAAPTAPGTAPIAR